MAQGRNTQWYPVHIGSISCIVIHFGLDNRVYISVTVGAILILCVYRKKYDEEYAYVNIDFIC